MPAILFDQPSAMAKPGPISMLSILRSRLLPVQFAIFALVLNAAMQAQCCVGAFEDKDVDSFHAEARATLCLTDGEDADTASDATGDLASFDAWAKAMAPGAAGHSGTGHADHGSGDCDCTDGMCCQALVALAVLQEVSIDRAGTDKVSPAKEHRDTSAHEANVFSARGPPNILL